jgi:hypothetical protein
VGLIPSINKNRQSRQHKNIGTKWGDIEHFILLHTFSYFLSLEPFTALENIFDSLLSLIWPGKKVK